MTRTMQETTTTAPPQRTTPPPWRASRNREIAAIAAACILVIVVGMLAGLIFSAAQQSVYEARAEVVFQASTDTATQAERVMETQRVVIGSRPRIAAVAETVGRPVSELEESTSVELLGDSQVMRVSVTDTDADRARAAAEGLTQQYVDDVGATATEDVADQRELLEEQIQTTEAQLEETESQLQELEAQRREQLEAARQRALEEASDSSVPTRLFDPDVVAPVTAQERSLEEEAGSLRRRLDELRSDLTDLELQSLQQQSLEESSAPSASVITPAYVLEDTVGPQPLQGAAAGALAGIALATALGLVLTRTWLAE